MQQRNRYGGQNRHTKEDSKDEEIRPMHRMRRNGRERSNIVGTLQILFYEVKKYSVSFSIKI